MDIQRLRNLTTFRLHTAMADIYEDIEYFTGVQGVTTLLLPKVADALLPYLREKLKDPRFWDGKYDPEHRGDVEVPSMSAGELEAFWERYRALT